jgi:polar amino acid transport system substrate-binding protein
MSRRLLIILAAVVVLGGLVLFGLNLNGQSQYTNNPQLASLYEKGELIVGTDPTYPPMEFVDENDQIVGLGVDVAKEVAKELGVKLTVEQLEWDKLFEAVNSGEVDMAISSITITQERAETYDFSNPYFSSGQSILVLTDNNSILNPEDLAGKTVAAYYQTTSEEEAIKLVGDEGQVVTYDTDTDPVISQLTAGDIDAIILDFPPAADAAKKHQEVKIVGDPFTSEFYGVMVKKGNSGLVSAINNTLSKIRKDNTLLELQNKWLKN